MSDDNHPKSQDWFFNQFVSREAAARACLSVAEEYPDLPEGSDVRLQALVRQSANIAQLCAERIRALRGGGE